MFSSMFWPEKKEKTRFESAQELKDVRHYLEQLRSQRDVLEKRINVTEDGKISKKKYEILNAIVTSFDEHIEQFNSQSVKADEAFDQSELRKFLLQLLKLLSSRDVNDVSTLAVRRNQLAETTIAGTALLGLGVATGAALGVAAAPVYYLGFVLPSTYLESIVGIYLLGVPSTVAAGAVSLGALTGVAQATSYLFENHKFNTTSNKLLQSLTLSILQTHSTLTKGMTKEQIQEEVDKTFSGKSLYDYHRVDRKWTR